MGKQPRGQPSQGPSGVVAFLTRNVHYGTFRGSGIFQNRCFKSRIYISNPILEELVRSKMSLHRGLECQSAITQPVYYVTHNITTQSSELVQCFFLFLTQEHRVPLQHLLKPFVVLTLRFFMFI